jgi:hypothetical protein
VTPRLSQRRLELLAARLCLLAVLSPAAGHCAGEIEGGGVAARDLRRHVTFLASDTLEGREAGGPGGRAAALYLAEHLRRFGLTPAGDADEFLQEFGHGYRNVLALLPGSDPALADEVVLLGAHFDHVGYGRRGNTYGPIGAIHNGADDNASGTAAVLEAAEALASLRPAPRRSVLFAFWDAEEIDLLGSQHWLAHPTQAAGKVRLVLNVDMVGRLRNETVTVHGCRTAEGLRQLLCLANRNADLRFEFRRQHVRDSDHYPFLQRRVPYLAFDTGKHEDYHRPSDDVDRLNFDGLQRVSELLVGLVALLADRPVLPRFREESWRDASEAELRVIPQLVSRPPRLGITWNWQDPPGTPLRVRSVDAGSPADRAGVLAEDVVRSFAGIDPARVRDFRALVAMAPRQVEVVVERLSAVEQLRFDVPLNGEPYLWGAATARDAAEPHAELVISVVPGSPAARLDLRPGDRILRPALFPQESDTADRDREAAATFRIEHEGRLRTITLPPDLP